MELSRCDYSDWVFHRLQRKMATNSANINDTTTLMVTGTQIKTATFSQKI